MTSQRADTLRRAAMPVAALLVTATDLATWLVAELTCNLSEGSSPDTMAELCGSSGAPGLGHLALGGAVVVPVSYLISRRAGRPWVLGLGVLAGLVAAALVWTWS